MDAYAVLETGGKQYRVTTGATIETELLDAEAGQDIELNTVLAVSDGKELKVGMPYVELIRRIVESASERIAA